MNNTPSGENRNWPNEPAAVPAPSESERQDSGTSLPKAASTMLKEQPESPKPISTGADHPHGAEAVGDGAGEGLADAPQQVLDREREGEYVAAPAVRLRPGLEEEAERRSRPEGQDRDQAAADDDHGRGAPRGPRAGGGGEKNHCRGSSGGRALPLLRAGS